MPYDILTSVSAVKAWKNPSNNSTNADDALLSSLIQVASEAIGRYCSRSNLGNIYTYQENYFPSRAKTNFTHSSWKIVLRHYPVATLVSVLVNNSPVTILTPTALQLGTSGVFLEEDEEPRTLRFIAGVALFEPVVVQVNYTAGYAPNAIPQPLQQAAIQYVTEILRSSGQVNLKSVAAAGETTSFDTGGQFGMSNRVAMMLQPFRNMIPWMGR